MRKTKLLIAVFLGLVCSKVSASETIQLAFEQTPLAEAVSFFSETSGLDVSIPEGFNPSITIHQTADDYRQAIEKIAVAAGLITIDMPTGFELRNRAERIGVLVIDLKHREAEQVLNLVESSRQATKAEVSVIADPETNRLVVRGDLSEVSAIQQLVEVLDVAVKQILIEAKLVSQDTDKRRDLGIRWSFATSEPGRSGIQGQTQGFPDQSGRSAMSLAFVSDPKLLALELQALESSGVGEVISEPRIVTTNRRAATIRQGQQLPFVTVDKEGRSSTEFKDAVLELKVTPILRDDGKIEMILEIRQDQVSQLITAQGPAIETRELQTRVTVDPEETLVLGGIYESREENVLVGIPGLSSIPILGQAFQSSQRRAFKSELLIFITPRIL